jgi:hypothetical protein
MRTARALLLRGPLVALLIIAASSSGAAGAQEASQPIFEDFTQDAIGASPTSFSTPVGFWSIGTVDGVKPLLFEDGRQYSSNSANLLADQAKALYGDRWAEFIDDLSETSYAPIAVFNRVENFSNGRVTLRFMVIGGDVDQDVGIMFNYQTNGDYITLRSDTHENNLLLYQWVQGQPTSLKRTRDVPTSFAEWHDQQLVISGTQMSGFLDGKKFLDYDLPAPVSGRLGVWAKTDTVALIDAFVVEPAE